MASDKEYMSFLDKANQDPGEGHAEKTQQGAQGGRKTAFKTTDADTQAPQVIKEACADAVYVTDADEPFDEVSLKWDGSGLPDESTLLDECLDAPITRALPPFLRFFPAFGCTEAWTYLASSVDAVLCLK